MLGKGGAEFFGFGVQHDAPAFDQEGARSDNMGVVAEIAGVGGAGEGDGGAWGQLIAGDTASPDHKDVTVLGEGKGGLTRCAAGVMFGDLVVFDVDDDFVVGDRAVALAPVEGVAGDAGLDVAAVEVGDEEPLAGVGGEGFLEGEATDFDVALVVPADRTPVQNRAGKPPAIAAHGSEGEAVVTVKKSGVDRGKGSPLAADLDDGAGAFHGVGVAPDRAEGNAGVVGGEFEGEDGKAIAP